MRKGVITTVITIHMYSLLRTDNQSVSFIFLYRATKHGFYLYHGLFIYLIKCFPPNNHKVTALWIPDTPYPRFPRTLGHLSGLQNKGTKVRDVDLNAGKNALQGKVRALVNSSLKPDI